MSIVCLPKRPIAGHGSPNLGDRVVPALSFEVLIATEGFGVAAAALEDKDFEEVFSNRPGGCLPGLVKEALVKTRKRSAWIELVNS